MHRRIASLVFLMTVFSYSETLVSPAHPALQYMGRIDRSNPKQIAFDWPGIVIQTIFTGTSCSAVFEGVNCFDIFIDGIHSSTVRTGTKKAKYPLAENLTDRSHRLVIAKRSESAGAPTVFYGLMLDKDKELVQPPPPSKRKIEFIGDSYTVGFADEYLGRECAAGKDDSIIFAATNTGKAFGPLVAKAFSAQYQINAVSGKGLVRNYNGIDKGHELPVCYERTLVSTVNVPDKAGEWDFSSWKPDVVVIGLGINDFQANPPYPDSTVFDTAYHTFIDKIRKRYPDVKIICCATKVWPTDALFARVKAIVTEEQRRGNKNIRYFDYISENGALYGHPNLHDHQMIAEELIPVVAEITGWHRTDMNRGK